MTAQQGVAPATTARAAPLVVAVDGGGSKTHAVVVDLDGDVRGEAIGPGASPHIIGLPAAIAVIDETVARARAQVADQPVAHAAIYLSGLDLPPELDAFSAAARASAWVPSSLVVENDLFALLRAGTDAVDAVAVVCGTGINAVGIRRDGEVVRFPALGMISGDWGGGWHLGEQALWHAARSVDGRGPATVLVETLPRVFGLGTVGALIEDLHFGRIPNADLARLSPAVFEAAAAGDPIGLSLVDRQADEIVALAGAALRRLGLEREPVPVVLGGGVLAAGDARLLAAVTTGIRRIAARAAIELVTAPPIVGAAVLALEQAGASVPGANRVREMLRGGSLQRETDAASSLLSRVR